MSRWWILTAGVLIAIGSMSCPARVLAQEQRQDVAPPATAPNPTPPVPARTELNGQIELARLLDICSQRLDLQITYDPSNVKDTVTVRLPQGLTDAEVWQLTNQVLATKGLATVELPGAAPRSLTVIKLADAPGLAKIESGPSPTGTQRGEGGAGFVNLVTRIEHQPVKMIVDALKVVLSKPSGAVVDLGSGGLILISDLKPRVDEALLLIDSLDVPSIPPIIETIPTQFVSAQQLAAMVTAASTARDAMPGPGGTGSATGVRGRVLPAPESSALIVICPPQELNTWKSLIAKFDQRQPVITRNHSAKYFGASEVAKLIEQADRDLSPRGSGDQWKLVIDDLSGSLIVTATPDEQVRITELIQRLDTMPREARRPVKVFAIRNRGVRELVDVLSKLLALGALDGPPTPTPTHAPAPPGEADSVRAATESRTTTRLPPPAVLEPPSAEAPPTDATGSQPGSPASDSSAKDTAPRSTPSDRSTHDLHAVGASATIPSLTLTADEPTNSIIAIGDPRKLAELESLIKRLDVRQPQVMIEVMVVSLTDSDSLDLGVELQKIEVFGNTTVNLASLFGLGSPSLLSSATPGTNSKGGSAIVLSPGDFSVVVRALQSLNKGRTLTLPKVLVNNNQQAKLDSVLQQPFVSTNASSTVATTSFGGSENAGTVITIKPQIAEADHLVLEYSVSISAFVGEASDPTVPPPKQSNNLSSIVTIPDGYTVVVGGLEIASQAQAVSQVPLLGSIPGVGELFKNRANSRDRSRFFVFIHSEVLRRDNFEDLKFISDQDSEAADIDDGWPVVEPRVIR